SRAKRYVKYNNPSSKYHGVLYNKFGKSWQGKVRYGGNGTYFIANFNTEIEAAIARDIKELEYYGMGATLNFPNLLEDYISGKISVRKKTKRTSPSKIRGVAPIKDRWFFRAKKDKEILFTRFFKTQQETEDFAIKYFDSINETDYYVLDNPIMRFDGFKTKRELTND